jgi:hypothetical protein
MIVWMEISRDDRSAAKRRSARRHHESRVRKRAFTTSRFSRAM